MIPRKAPSVCGYPIPICRAEVCAAPDCDAIIRRPERGAAERWCLEVIHLDLLSPLLSSGRSSIERRPPRLAGISLRGLAGPPLQRNIALTIRARRVPARTPSEWRRLCLLNDPPIPPYGLFTMGPPGDRVYCQFHARAFSTVRSRQGLRRLGTRQYRTHPC